MLARLAKSIEIRAYSHYVLARRKRVERKIARLVSEDRHHLRFVFHAPGVGLFAHLNWALWICAALEKTNTSFEFAATSPNYSDNGNDWFKDLFDQPLADPKGRRTRKIALHGWEDTPFHRNGGIVIDDFERAHALQSKFFPVKESIVEAAREFVARHFSGNPYVACHYRGTDKSSEAPRLSYEAVMKRLKSRSNGEARLRLFVATDERPFIEAIRAQPEAFDPAWMDCERSTDGQKIHGRARGLHLRRAKEALLDCLVLSQAERLVKTASMLSGWAKVFNPQLPVELLARPYEKVDWFPDRLNPALPLVDSSEDAELALGD